MTKHVLIIGFVWPEPKSSAAGSRMMQLIEVFQSFNYKITFASTCAKQDQAFDLNLLDIQQVSIELNNASFDEFLKTVKNKNLSPRLKKLKKGILIKSPFKKKPLAKSA